MKEVTIFFNAACSKCRGTLDLLKERGIEPQIVNYLDENPSRDTILELLDQITDEPTDLVRKDSHFDELGLDAKNYKSKESVADLLVEHPRLLQRPVVVFQSSAVIARPPERISEILD